MLSSITNIISKKYKDMKFLDRYGLDVLVSLILCIIFLLVNSYYYVQNNIQPIKADWNNKKCSPSVIPFAGLINNGPNVKVLEFTVQNFSGCIQSTLTNLASIAFQPLWYSLANISSNMSQLTDGLSATREVANTQRKNHADATVDVMERASNVTTPIIGMFVQMKAFMSKITGMLSGIMYTVYGMYLMLKSLVMNICNILVMILVIIAAEIVALWVIALLPLGIGAYMVPVAIINTVIMTIILILVIIIEVYMERALDMIGPHPPAVPSCFAGSTPVDMLDPPDFKKPICEVELGDNLKDGGVVTGVFKMSASGQTIYNLNGVIVTGEHRVYDLDNKKWINVKNHPQSRVVTDYSDPYVYCLNTTTKMFFCGANIFSDWDDLDEKVRADLAKTGLLPHNFVGADVHACLDTGLCGEMLLPLEDGVTFKPISEVQVNDVLLNGIVVKGEMRVLGDDLGVYRHDFNTNTNNDKQEIRVLATKQLHVQTTNSETIHKTTFTHRHCSTFYQLLTDEGYFYLNDEIKIRDYNSGIDVYLTT